MSRAKPPKQSRPKQPEARDKPASFSSPKILTVVAETDHYVVVDKPALLDSQNSKEGRGSVVDWLQDRYGYAGLVHRLDFGTSGLMVCAKDAQTAKHLTGALQAGKIDRIYQAVVLGKILPDTGEFVTPLENQAATTRFRVLERFTNATWVEVELETGRKHQIRKHFSEANHPLLGDHLHGKRGSDRLFDRPALHAVRLRVEGIEYESPLPNDLIQLLAKLRASTAKHS